MLSPIAYLTCELKSRDFDSRLLIAAELIKLGYFVVVGQYWGLVFGAGTALRGCYLFKTANQFQAQAMRKCAGLGHKVVAADEEALPMTEGFSHSAVDPMAFDYCDTFLALNPGHKRALLARFPNATGKVVVAGTARTDLLKQAKTPRPRPERYVLVNTVFGFINSSWGSVDAAIQVYAEGLKLDLDDPASRRQVDDRLDYEKAAMIETIALIDGLLARTAGDIVIRPHPSERPEFWRAKYESQPRVIVVNRSDPVQWIQHAALMIHCDSTTGIEAAILGTPCINLSPQDAWATRLILRTANYTVPDAGQAVEATVRFLRDPACLSSPPGAHELFPAQAAQAAARAIQQLLPKPGPLSGMKWERILRNSFQKEKFTVSPEEAQAAVQRVFPLAGVAPKPLIPLDDSLFVLSPQ